MVKGEYYIVVRKKAGEPLEKSHPWKATTGYICHDARTEADAQQFADQENKK